MRTTISGPPRPPAGFEAQRAAVDIYPAAAKTLNVPAFTWEFGCSSVSAAMIAGYYDRIGYYRMYAGPTNGGVMPLVSSAWPKWWDGLDTYPSNPLIASRKGLDGRTSAGSIDDYWIQYGSSTKDPYLTRGVTQHAWGSAIGDYMKTSQSSYENTDGSTSFYNWPGTAQKLTCSDMETYSAGGGYTIAQLDGTYGRKLFYQARGYTVTDCYNQNTDNNAAGGFSYANYKAEIDAGRPVFLNLAGHSVVGVGYSDPSTVYVHDTWDTLNHQMTWGGSYSGMQLMSVSVVNLQPILVPTPMAPKGTITTTTPVFTWSKVPNATQYQFQVLKSGVVKYAVTVAATSCGANVANCSNKPSTILTTGSYSWRVRAMIGGTWRAWSAGKAFTK